jgi:hypothetical protein
VPHIVVITGEPLPSRIASLALGTGDIDCVYHFALPELSETLVESELEDALELLEIMTTGSRLKDISDLTWIPSPRSAAAKTCEESAAKGLP